MKIRGQLRSPAHPHEGFVRASFLSPRNQSFGESLQEWHHSPRATQMGTSPGSHRQGLVVRWKMSVAMGTCSLAPGERMQQVLIREAEGLLPVLGRWPSLREAW